jgi:hypothetical protein
LALFFQIFQRTPIFLPRAMDYNSLHVGTHDESLHSLTLVLLLPHSAVGDTKNNEWTTKARLMRSTFMASRLSTQRYALLDCFYL